jgi:DNA invertase Pin-like site-specific DNA recombinase
MPTRVPVYARVSTANHGQDVSMQTQELRQFAEARGWTVAGQKTSRIRTAKCRRFSTAMRQFACGETICF